jgi:hypothetical protein
MRFNKGPVSVGHLRTKASRHEDEEMADEEEEEEDELDDDEFEEEYDDDDDTSFKVFEEGGISRPDLDADGRFAFAKAGDQGGRDGLVKVCEDRRRGRRRRRVGRRRV